MPPRLRSELDCLHEIAGYTRLASRSLRFGLLLAQGLIPKHGFIHKFGEAQNVDDGVDVDIWDGSTISTSLRTYVFSAAADIDRLSSSDNGDTQSIEVQGLDTNWDLVVQTITLTGQTSVALTTSLRRVFRLKNEGSTDNAGNIYCFVNVATTAGVPNTIGNTRAIIQIGNNQTLMAVYTVPNGKTGYLSRFFMSNSNRMSQVSDVSLLVRPVGGVFQLKSRTAIGTDGTSHIQHLYDVPEVVAAKSDIIMEANSSANDGIVSAGFDIILIDD